MQANRRMSDLSREGGCTEAFLSRAAKDRRTYAGKQNSRDGMAPSSILSKGAGARLSASCPSNTGGMTVREAGRRGGLACLRNRGKRFFVEIGARGQWAMRQRNPGMAAEWGKLGGRPRKPTLGAIMGEGRK